MIVFRLYIPNSDSLFYFIFPSSFFIAHKKKLNKDRNLLRNQLEDLIAETHLPDGTKIPGIFKFEMASTSI